MKKGKTVAPTTSLRRSIAEGLQNIVLLCNNPCKQLSGQYGAEGCR